MLNAAQLAERLGIPESTLTIWRRIQIGPPALMACGRPVYLDGEVEAWLDSGGALVFGIALAPDALGRVGDDVAGPVLADGDGEQVGT